MLSPVRILADGTVEYDLAEIAEAIAMPEVKRSIDFNGAASQGPSARDLMTMRIRAGG